MSKKRSVGVTVVGIIMLIYGLWLSGIFMSVFVNIIGMFYGEKNAASFMNEFSLLSIPIFVRKTTSPFLAILRNQMVRSLLYFMGLIYLISSTGILRLKNWARLFAIYSSTVILVPFLLFLIGLVIAIINGVTQGGGASMIGAGFMLIILLSLLPFFLFSFLFLISLTRPKVKEQFKKGDINA